MLSRFLWVGLWTRTIWKITSRENEFSMLSTHPWALKEEVLWPLYQIPMDCIFATQISGKCLGTNWLTGLIRDPTHVAVRQTVWNLVPPIQTFCWHKYMRRSLHRRWRRLWLGVILELFLEGKIECFKLKLLAANYEFILVRWKPKWRLTKSICRCSHLIWSPNPLRFGCKIMQDLRRGCRMIFLHKIFQETIDQRSGSRNETQLKYLHHRYYLNKSLERTKIVKIEQSTVIC